MCIRDSPVTEPEKTFEEVLDEHPVSIQVNGQWQTFPNAKAAAEASYEEYQANLRRNAQNFRITDEHLGDGGPKAKFQANINAIRLLKELEVAGQQARSNYDVSRRDKETLVCAYSGNCRRGNYHIRAQSAAS